MLALLRTQRLCLCPVTPGDMADVWRLLVMPDVRRYLCDNQVMPREAVEAIVNRAIGHAPRGLGMWVLRHDAAMVGIAALQPVPDILVQCAPELAGEVEPTIALDPAKWGLGLASEALAATLDHGFATLGLARIAAVADAPNTASRRMLARAGFRQTGEWPGPAYRICTFALEAPRPAAAA